MSLVVQQRLTPTPGAIQVFVGDFGASRARTPAFKLNGTQAVPETLRPMSSMRGPAEGVAEDSDEARVFTGIYEFRNLVPARGYALEVTLDETHLLDARTLPASVPSRAEGGFDVLLASCFCRQESNDAVLRRAIGDMKSSLIAKPFGVRAPDCSLFMGDQVYLDLPTLENFPNDRAKLAKKFEGNYALNWQAHLAPLFALAPSACLPDDHEFWNNAPHLATAIQNSWTKEGRKTWRLAAQRAFDAFARPAPDDGEPGDCPTIVTVEPLSFFLADGRSGRSEERLFTLTEKCRAGLSTWIAELNQQNRVGIFITGQSLFRKPVSSLTGQLADWEMANYRDFETILGELGKAKNRLLCLTGDVHFGRVVLVKNRFTNQERVHEVIVSPLSLVSAVGVDRAKSAWNGARDLFGPKRPWPRHGDGEPPPPEFGTGALGRHPALFAQTTERQKALIKGDQIGLLSFAFDQARARLSASITYFPLHDQIRKSTRVELFDGPVSS